MTQVLVLGNATLDVIQHVDWLPAPGETLLSGLPQRCAGGKGLNQALAAARTGASTRLVAAVGVDADASFLARQLAGEDGLDASWLARPDLPTDMSAIWVAQDGENMIVSSASCARSLSVDEARAACASLRPGDVLLMQGNLTRDATEAGARAARAKGATTVLNTAPVDSDMASILSCFDIVIANMVEAQQLTGLEGEAAAMALQQVLAGVVVMTLGAGGALVAERSGVSLVPAPKVVAVDASGAGDVMVGTLAGFIAQKWPIQKAAAVAVASASLSVTRTGTTPSFPSRKELLAITTSFPSQSSTASPIEARVASGVAYHSEVRAVQKPVDILDSHSGEPT